MNLLLSPTGGSLLENYPLYHLKTTHFIAKNTSLGLFTPQAAAE